MLRPKNIEPKDEQIILAFVREFDGAWNVRVKPLHIFAWNTLSSKKIK